MLHALPRLIRNTVMLGAAFLAGCGGDGKVTDPDEDEPSLQVTAIRQAGTGQPIDANNVRDSIQVVVNALNLPTGSCVEAVIDTTPASACMPVAARPAPGALLRSASMSTSGSVVITLSVNTAELNALGPPKFLNGPRQLSARVLGPSGTVTAATAQTITLNNQNFLAGQIAFGAGPIAAGGQNWYAPPVNVTARPVIFDANAVSNVVVLLSPASGTPLTATANAANGYNAVFSSSALANVTGVYNLSVTSTYANGTAGPSGVRGINNFSFFLDSKPPISSLLSVPFNRWLNGSYNYTLAGAQPMDDGVGGVTARYGYTLAGSSNFIAVTDPRQIPETSTNNVYDLTVEVTDTLRNRGIYKSTPTVGVDRRRPTLSVNLSGRHINPTPNLFWTRTDNDPTPGSGIDLSWRRASIFHVTPAQNFCVLGTFVGGNCTTVINNNTPLPIFPNFGLIEYFAEVWDNAGNISTAKVDVLNDLVAPQVTITTAPTVAPAGGASATITATVIENLDIDNSKLEQRFSNGTTTFDLPLGSILHGGWGRPLQFGTFNPQFQVQHLRSLERTDSSGRPTRTVVPSVGYSIQTRDQARNRTDAYSAHTGGNAPTTSYADILGRLNIRGTVQLRVETSDTSIQACPAGHSPSITVDVTTANGGANPFPTGIDLFSKVDMVPFRLIRITAPTVTEVGTGPEARTHSFSFSYDPKTAPWTVSGLRLSGTNRLFAVGINATYDVLESPHKSVTFCR